MDAASLITLIMQHSNTLLGGFYMNLTVKEFKKLFSMWADTMAANKDYLINLDSIVGDGDLGLTMSDGFAAASKAAQDSDTDDLGNLFYFAGKAMSVAVPSTMGTLMASGLMEAGKNLKRKTQLELYNLGSIFEYYMNGVMLRGKAKIGEKTFIDGLHPAIQVLKEANENSDMTKIMNAARTASEEGAKNTTTMLAVHGRAAIRGEQSRSLLDPGAIVASLIVGTAADFVKSLN